MKNNQALREEFQYMQEIYSEPEDKGRRELYSAAEALLDELEARTASEALYKASLKQADAELEAAGKRIITVKLPADYHNADGSLNADMMNTCAVVSAFREPLTAAGIAVKVDPLTVPSKL